MWFTEERSGDLTWLFAGDDVINIRQVRRFHLTRNPAAGDKLVIYYLDGTPEYFTGETVKVIWKALCKASEGVNVKAG